ncbi:MAG: hypothetical protein QOE99_411 [Actinomycetota bacterium]|jgi:hypothetical protein|nr:hypothetical protein [Actinomycetota bacterium]
MRRRTAALLALAPVLSLALVGTAAADAPTKSAWWNAATANGVALPAPTTSADDLHLGQGPTGPSALAAVGYDLVGLVVSSARLQLKVTANSAVGTIDVVACPTKDASWKAGGNQPFDARPAYDCALGSRGLVAADGTSVTFLLESAQQAAGGGYSLAIVPTDGAQPFTVDFTKPDATSLTPEVDTAAAEQPAAAAPAPAPPTTTGTSGAAPISAGTVAAPPPVAPVVQTPAVAAPVVPAPQAAPAPVAPAAASRPLTPVSNRDRYAAGSMLALLAGLVVWAFQQPRPQPRLIGGAARAAGPAVQELVSTVPRGIGRFAVHRTAPARPLV